MRDTGFLLCIGIRNFRTKPLSSFCVEVVVSSVASVIVDVFVPELVPDVVSFPVDSLLSSCVEVDVPAVASVIVDKPVPVVVSLNVTVSLLLNGALSVPLTVRPERPLNFWSVHVFLLTLASVSLFSTLSSFCSA